MKNSNKPKIEYRYYQLPENFPVLALLGEKWIRKYGEDKPIEYLHFHNHFEIGFCHWGKGNLALNNEILAYQAETFSLIPRKFPHTTNNDGHGLSYWEYLYIDVDKFLSETYMTNPIVAERMINTINKKAYFLSAADYPELAILIKQALEIIRCKKDLYEEEIKGILLALLIQIVRLATDTPEENNFQLNEIVPISPALDYIKEHFDVPITIGRLAAKCDLSETHFRRIFTQCMGKSPVEYINWIRIKTACNLLKNTNASIGYIAEKVGFSTPSTFNRNFRNILKVSPQEWRKRPEHYERSLLNYSVITHEGW
ncbi:helix-turn-helix domain-containing protein [Mediterraneibacter gnavus]|uniref:helix-turn-helix domain-containing protein n=1 Tax=Mediterraneibacter gnavus TaxID=33038 RepID=UPI00232E0E2C|nr:AraC family transcriptional regulator [Mediterraneibacter gnavus]MDB8711103.1 AraC family transcriptional regulator [Mediterraneibacter gnavus]MDB8714457.1 AraC family transcriptional regulator [Mediterraneibacter gnavus]